MNLNYFNPETSNHSDYFWFKNFQPDVVVNNERGKLNKTIGTAGENVVTVEAKLFKRAIDPIFSNILNSTVMYVDNDTMENLIDFLDIDVTQCTDCLVLDGKNYIFSIQINYGMGVRHILLRAEHYIDAQAHCNFIYYQVNHDKYINREDFNEKFQIPVTDSYVKFYMRKFDRLDEKIKRRAVFR